MPESDDELVAAYKAEIDLRIRAEGGAIETVVERLKAQIPSRIKFLPAEVQVNARAVHISSLDLAAVEYRAQVERIETFRRPALRGNGREKWYLGPDSSAATWNGFRKHLEDMGRPAEVIHEVDRASTGILSLMDRPSKDKFRTQGLVVGHVQSGKTQAMAALLAKAANTEYRFFVVLAGLTDVLREQTQARLTSDVTSRDPTQWHVFTSHDSDFSEPAQSGFQFTPGVSQLAVVKKNGGVLRRLKAKLRNTREIDRSRMAFMIIDDECDQASVNASAYIDRMTAINKLIRELLDLMPKSAYVGFTATPFANVLIDPVVHHGRMPDLYPKDFIYPLDAPKAYFGAEKLFGRSALGVSGFEDEVDGFDMIRDVPQEEVSSLKPAGAADRDTFTFEITSSLSDAIDYFLLCVACRFLRGQDSEHSSMLVHTTYFTAVHERIAAKIREYLLDIDAGLRAGSKQILARFQSAWDKERDRVPPGGFGRAPTAFSELLPLLPRVLAELEVKVENSRSESRLDYRKEAPRRYIVVGGNVLARGVTVEGLIVSYFLRTSNQYDTLMQMGRWFGYRPGYEDLPRLWMEQSLRQSFRDLAAVEAEMRMALKVYHEQQVTPLDFAVKIKQIPGMAITARSKMHHAQSCEVSFGGTHLQTTRFRRDLDWLKSNWDAGSSLIEVAAKGDRIPTPNRPSCAVFTKVPFREVIRFFGTYSVHPTHVHMEGSSMAEYIRSMVGKGKTLLSEWNVAVIGATDNDLSERDLGPLGKVPLNTRTSLQDVGIDADIKALMSKQDILVDFAEPPDLAWEEAKKKRKENGSPPLLLLYPVDRNSAPTAGRTNRTRLNAPADVLGIGVVFPSFEGDASYVSVVLPPRDVDGVDEAELKELDEAPAMVTP